MRVAIHQGGFAGGIGVHWQSYLPTHICSELVRVNCDIPICSKPLIFKES